jgi:hypothetical protein
VASKPYTSKVNQSFFFNIYICMYQFFFLYRHIAQFDGLWFLSFMEIVEKKENQLHEVVHLFFQVISE